MNDKRQQLLNTVRDAYHAGLCIVPPAQDKSKRPKPGASFKWEDYKSRRPTNEELNGWYDSKLGRTGVGIVCGAVSNNLEAFDGDDLEAWEPFKDRAIKWGLGSLIEKLEKGYFERTPGGAGHFLYYCKSISGNIKLATRPKQPEEKKHPKDSTKTIFETRGEGGYIIIAPTYGSVHETEKPYILVSGGITTIPTITHEERQALHDLARSFHIPSDKDIAKAVSVESENIKGGGRPGDDFNVRATWGEVLEPHEWKRLYTCEEIDHWQKPGGKAGATHATTNYADSDLLWVFSTATSFEAERGYSKFAAYTHLSHNGDFKAAAKDLAARGYGVTSPEAEDEKYTPSSTVALVCADKVETRPINWLWRGWLAGGKLHIFAGAPGTGKTTCAYSIAATISTGGAWPDKTKFSEPRNVLIWSGEDAADDTIVPRLSAAGADLSKVHIISAIQNTEGKRPFDPSTDMPLLFPEIKKLKPSLLIVDSIVSAVSGDSHKNTETRRGLQPLVDIGEKFGVAILGISHFTKGTSGKDPLERVTGSLAFGALARIVWAAAKLPEGNPYGYERIFARVKSNIGPDGDGFGYALKSEQIGDIETVKILWGGTINGNARELLAESTDNSALRETKQFLLQFLEGGPQSAKDVKKAAQDAGISKSTLDRAKSALGIIPGKQGFDKGWVWPLPTTPRHPA